MVVYFTHAVFTGQFRVSECLKTSDGVPVANLLLLESVKYPGHYLRWYDGSKNVDCQVWIEAYIIIIINTFFFS